MSEPLLWHIPLSHFNEKVRWTLDYKRIPHRRQVLGPNYLFRAWRATGQGHLPILFLDGKPIHDSTRIIAALEERYPDPAIFPKDDRRRARALRAVTTGMPERAYKTLRPLLRVFPTYYRLRHKISDAQLEADRATVAGALDRIEQERAGKPYLVGDAFSVADLTAASLLSPLMQPPQIQYPLQVKLPDYIETYRASVMRHPAAQWALGIYREHRGRSHAVARPKE